jgi:hypothetical protein
MRLTWRAGKVVYVGRSPTGQFSDAAGTRVKVGLVRGQGASRRDAAKHAMFSKWDRDFMLQART